VKPLAKDKKSESEKKIEDRFLMILMTSALVVIAKKEK